MGFLTEREKEIMRLLKYGKRVKDIGKYYKVSDASVSKSISNAKNKIVSLENDIEFLIDIGFMKIVNNNIEWISESRDPKALAREG